MKRAKFFIAILFFYLHPAAQSPVPAVRFDAISATALVTAAGYPSSVRRPGDDLGDYSKLNAAGQAILAQRGHVQYYPTVDGAVSRRSWPTASTSKAVDPQLQQFPASDLSLSNAEMEVLRYFINTNGSQVPHTAAKRPVITMGTSSATLTGASVSRYDSRIRYIGGHTIENFDNIQPGSYPKSLFITAKNLSFSSTERSAVGSIVEFDITCPKFEILEYENGGGVRVLVDNQIAGGYAYPVTGDLIYRLFDFTAIDANPVQRHIRLEYSDKAVIGGLTLGATGSLLPLQDVVNYSICWLGDSFTEGTGTGSTQAIHEGLAAYASKILGFRDYRMSGFGGTGYNVTCATNFSSLRPSLADRINYDGINADVFVIAMGINDRESDTALAAKIASTFNNLREKNPTSIIFVLGPFGNGLGGNIKPNVENKIISAAANRPGVEFISIYDIAFTKSDATHPDAAGHVTLGTAIASRIKTRVGIVDTTLQTPFTGNGKGLKGLYLYYDPKLGTLPDTSRSNVYLERIDSTIDFEFTYSKQPLVLSPAPGIVPVDFYSVRWTGQVQAMYSETYTFYSLSDDGVRLWVNGVQLVDNWVNQGATENSGIINLVAGQKYDIKIEYYENTGESVTKLYWSSKSTLKTIVPKLQLYPPVIQAAGTGLQGVYYSGIGLSGTPLLTHVDPAINFELTYSKQPLVLSPAPGIVPEDHYSVRWTGQVQAIYSEAYTFYTVSDDGVRLWVNWVKLVDNWVNQGTTEKSGSITLMAGQKYDIMMEYYENTGESVAKLYWSSASTTKAIIPQLQLYPAGYGTAPVPACAVNTLPGNATTISTQTTAALAWVAVANAVSYDVYILTGATMPASPVANSSTATYNATGLTAATMYSWYIVPKNASGAATGCSTGNKTSFTTATANSTGTGTGLQGAYYNGIALSGTPLLTRIDPVINFEMTYSQNPQVFSPAPGIVPVDLYSIRWTGQVQALYAETYTFYTVADDGIRLWVNGVQLVNNWINQGTTEKSGSIALAAGQKYDIVIEYYENTGESVSKLFWSSPSTAKAIVPKAQLYPPTAGARTADTAALQMNPLLQPAAILFGAGISPNPVTGTQQARLQITSNKIGLAVVTVINSNGCHISNRIVNLVKGINTAIINTAGLAQGLYLVSIKCGEKPVTLKLVIN